MKFAILCTMMNNFGRKGYYNCQEIGLGRALVAKGHTVTIYKGSIDVTTEEHIVLQERLDIFYLPLKRIGAHGYFPCRLFAPGLDGLLVFGDQQIFLPHVYRWCKRHDICFVPYIGTAHSFYAGTMRGRVMDALFAAGTLRIYRKLPVLAKTSEAERELRALGIQNITVTPVGLDEAVLKKDFRTYDRTVIREKFGYASDDVVVAYVARLSTEKRPLEMLQIFSQAKSESKKSFKLLIVGKGELYDALTEKIHDCSLEQDVTLLESVPYENMWEIYVSADYFVNLNRGEIFGMAIMEAVYYCTSVAASRALGPSLTLDGMKGHCLCDTDEQIVQWLTEPYPSQEVLEQSAKRMTETFTWERCADAFVEIVNHS